MNLREIEVIHAIIRAGSVTGAAKLLNISQPAVSNTLRHCEDQLNFKLFQRSGGKIYPTAEVLAMYPDIAEIFRHYQTVNRVATELVGGRLGRLSVGAAFSISQGPLAAAIAEFRRGRPEVCVTVQALPSSHVLERIVRKEVDVGFIFGNVDVPEVTVIRQRSAELCCMLRTDDPLAHKSTVSAEDLDGRAVVSYAAHTHIGAQIDRVFQERETKLDRSIQINHPLMALNLVASGAGIALIEPIVWTSDRYPDLKIVPFRPSLLVKSSMVTPVDTPLFKATETFMEIAWRHIEAATIPSSAHFKQAT